MGTRLEDLKTKTIQELDELESEIEKEKSGVTGVKSARKEIVSKEISEK